ncbi:MAG: N-acetylmuramoyl-L-alanine amidase, partial [Chitinophagaceae bacterium]|nr:N-acetylmuramoyl-L-alanine amidase [Chitinophagaceae bacterium]
AGGWYERRVVGKVPYTKYVKKGKKTYKRKAYRYKYSKVWVPNKAKGTETYLWALNKDDAKKTSVAKNDFTEDMDSLSTLALPDPTDPAEKVRMLIYTRHFFKKSLQLADLVQEQFKKAGRIDRGVKQRNNKGIWVLQATAMPSILIEIGFISNKEEEDYMLSDKGQKEIVGNIFTAIKKYKETLEKQASPVKKVPVKPVKTPN